VTYNKVTFAVPVVKTVVAIVAVILKGLIVSQKIVATPIVV
jgi:hypothetical protein